MLSFFPCDVLDEILNLLSPFLRVFLPTHDCIFIYVDIKSIDKL